MTARIRVEDARLVAPRLSANSVPEPNTGCWLWFGAKGVGGYGVLSVRSRKRLAHRVAWVLANRREIRAGKMICHRCDNPPCVNPDHLYEGTNRENSRDKVRRNRQPRGSQVGGAKLTGELAARLRAARTWSELRQIAAKAGVSENHAREVRRARSWKHLGPPASERLTGIFRRGEQIESARLTERDVVELRRRVSSGETQTSLALEFGITQSAVSLIVRGRRWKHVEGGVQ